ncbi:MAG: hypothetical protein HY791_33745 [Deltaproteobacteria bacterium]|nr:hypothetical protein [Deltaproteobacteria bacterium]
MASKLADSGRLRLLGDEEWFLLVFSRREFQDRNGLPLDDASLQSLQVDLRNFDATDSCRTCPLAVPNAEFLMISPGHVCLLPRPVRSLGAAIPPAALGQLTIEWPSEGSCGEEPGVRPLPTTFTLLPPDGEPNPPQVVATSSTGVVGLFAEYLARIVWPDGTWVELAPEFDGPIVGAAATQGGFVVASLGPRKATFKLARASGVVELAEPESLAGLEFVVDGIASRGSEMVIQGTSNRARLLTRCSLATDRLVCGRRWAPSPTSTLPPAVALLPTGELALAANGEVTVHDSQMSVVWRGPASFDELAASSRGLFGCSAGVSASVLSWVEPFVDRPETVLASVAGDCRGIGARSDGGIWAAIGDQLIGVDPDLTVTRARLSEAIGLGPEADVVVRLRTDGEFVTLLERDGGVLVRGPSGPRRVYGAPGVRPRASVWIGESEEGLEIITTAPATRARLELQPTVRVSPRSPIQGLADDEVVTDAIADSMGMIHIAGHTQSGRGFVKRLRGSDAEPVAVPARTPPLRALTLAAGRLVAVGDDLTILAGDDRGLEAIALDGQVSASTVACLGEGATLSRWSLFDVDANGGFAAAVGCGFLVIVDPVHGRAWPIPDPAEFGSTVIGALSASEYVLGGRTLSLASPISVTLVRLTIDPLSPRLSAIELPGTSVSSFHATPQVILGENVGELTLINETRYGSSLIQAPGRQRRIDATITAGLLDDHGRVVLAGADGRVYVSEEAR